MIHFPVSKRDSFAVSVSYRLAKYGLELLVIGAAYFVLEKISFALTLIHPNEEFIWPPAGLALAAVLLRGLRVWPAILVAALVANLPVDISSETAASSILSSSIGAASGTLAAIVGGYLIGIWSDGCRTFDTPTGVAKFTSAAGASTMIGALVGVGGLSLAGHAEWSGYGANVVSWWLRDLVGALVIAPVLVLWATSEARNLTLTRMLASGEAFAAAVVVGLVAWSPLFDSTLFRSTFAFLSVLPILWAAFRCGPRDTATVAFILTCFAIWGALAGNGLFKETVPINGFALLTMFLLGMTILSLALSAEISLRDRLEARLRHREYNLRSMFSQTGVGVAQTDTTGRFVLANQQFCNIVKRPIAELLQMHAQDLSERDGRSQLLTLLGQAVHTGEGFAIESSHALPDGSCFWIRNHVSAIRDLHGVVRYLMIVAEDITARRDIEQDTQDVLYDLKETIRENAIVLDAANDALQVELQKRKLVEAALKHDVAERRKAQEALVESEWRFRLFIQGVTDYAIFMLDPDGYITNWNTGAQRIHQYPGAEIVGQHFSKFYSEEEQQRGEPARALQVAATRASTLPRADICGATKVSSGRAS